MLANPVGPAMQACQGHGQYGTPRTDLASRGSGVRVPLAPPGETSSSKIATCPTVAIICRNGSVLGLIEQTMQPGNRIPLCWVAAVGVDLQGCADPRVPEDRLRVAGGHAEVFQK